MSNILEEAIKALEEKLEDKSIDFSAKFQIEDEGSIVVMDGVRESSEETDCTLIASAETFRNILEGETNPTSAFMGGILRLKVVWELQCNWEIFLPNSKFNPLPRLGIKLLPGGYWIMFKLKIENL